MNISELNEVKFDICMPGLVINLFSLCICIQNVTEMKLLHGLLNLCSNSAANTIELYHL